jgi:ribosomal protein S18 acetylase RimI-like enzyme
VIEDGSLPIGRLYVDRAPDEIHVLDIALVPERRGAGIGAALLGELIGEAGQARIPVSLYVEQFNPALRFYERLGFERVAIEGVYWMMRWPAVGSSAAEAFHSNQNTGAGQ